MSSSCTWVECFSLFPLVLRWWNQVSSFIFFLPCRHTTRPFSRSDQHAVHFFHGRLWQGAGRGGLVRAVQRSRGEPGEAALGHLWVWGHSMSRCHGCPPARAPWGVCLRRLLVWVVSESVSWAHRLRGRGKEDVKGTGRLQGTVAAPHQ